MLVTNVTNISRFFFLTLVAISWFIASHFLIVIAYRGYLLDLVNSLHCKSTLHSIMKLVFDTNQMEVV